MNVAKKPVKTVMPVNVIEKLGYFQTLCQRIDERVKKSSLPKPQILKQLGCSATSLRSWRNGKVPINASIERLIPVFEAYLESGEDGGQEVLEEIRDQLKILVQRSSYIESIHANLEALCEALLLDEVGSGESSGIQKPKSD